MIKLDYSDIKYDEEEDDSFGFESLFSNITKSKVSKVFNAYYKAYDSTIDILKENYSDFNAILLNKNYHFECSLIRGDIKYRTVYDIDKIEENINSNTKLLAAKNMYGSTCDLDLLQEVAKRNNLVFVVDNSHSYGSTYKGKRTLEYCDFEITGHSQSMYSYLPSIGVIHTGEKYARDLLHEYVRYSNRLKILPDGLSEYLVEKIGYTSLKDFWRIFYIRRSNIDFMRNIITTKPFYRVNEEDDSTRFNAPFAFNVYVDDKDEANKFRKNIDGSLVEFIHHSDDVFSFPCHHGLSVEEMNYIIYAIEKAFNKK